MKINEFVNIINRCPPLRTLILIAVLILVPAWLSESTGSENDKYSKYLDQLRTEREGNWIKRKLLENKTYPHLDKAYRLMDKGDLAGAKREIEKYLKIDPDDLKVRFTYLLLLHRMNDYSEVADQANAILKKQPGFVPAIIYRGLAYQSLGQPDKAIADFKSVVDSKNVEREDRVFALTMVSDIAIGAKRYEEALAASDELIKNDKSFRNYLRLGIVLEESERLEEAAHAYQNALDSSRTSGERLTAYKSIGEAANKRRDWEAAKNAFVSAHQLEPNKPELLRSLAHIFYNEKDYSESAKWMRKALELNPDSNDREFYANILFVQKDYRSSAKEFEKLLSERENDEDRFRVYMSLGNLYTDWGKYSQATEVFEQAAEIRSDFTTLNSLALSYEREGRINEAIKYHKDSLKNGPNSQTHYMLGVLYSKAGKNRLALSHFEKAERGDLPPGLKVKVYEELGLLYRKTNNISKARAVLESALKLRETSASKKAAVYEKLGYIDMDIRRYEQAVDNFRRAINMGRDGWRIRQNFGYALMQLSDWDEAVKQFAISLNGRNIPKNRKTSILEDLGFVHMRVGRYEQAADSFRTVVEMGNDGWLIRRNLGFALYKLQRWEEALSEFVVSLEYKKTPRTLSHIGRCYKEMNKPGMAIHYLEQALAMEEPR